MRKVVLITGTSTGLGLEAALLMAQHDYKVYASMRNTAKKDLLLNRASALGLTIPVIELDVCNPASIEKAVHEIIEKENRLDLLINNAGAGFAKTTEHASDKDVLWVMETNYLSVVRCTRAVLPIMRKQKAGHIINVSSVGGLVGQPFNELYCAAKFAVEGYTEALATYLTKHFGIHFTLVEPGGIVTEFNNSALKKTMGEAGMPDDDYLPILEKYISGIRKRAAEGQAQSYQQAGDVAKVILDVIQSDNPPLRVRTSAWAEAFCSFKTGQDPTGNLQNEMVIQRFLQD